jgi:hypothetical protein
VAGLLCCLRQGLKCDEKFLYGLLTLSQEQNIKTGRFSMIYADEVIISHTNENEYNSFVNNKKNEALKDRMILMRATDLQSYLMGLASVMPGSLSRYPVSIGFPFIEELPISQRNYQIGCQISRCAVAR